MSEDFPAIGSQIVVVPEKDLEDGRWLARCEALPSGWMVHLITRGTGEVTSGQPLSAWVFRINAEQRVIELFQSSFGFMPISDRMRPRYLVALERLMQLVGAPQSVVAADATFVSEVKGMFSRSYLVL